MQIHDLAAWAALAVTTGGSYGPVYWIGIGIVIIGVFVYALVKGKN